MAAASTTLNCLVLATKSRRELEIGGYKREEVISQSNNSSYNKLQTQCLSTLAMPPPSTSSPFPTRSCSGVQSSTTCWLPPRCCSSDAWLRPPQSTTISRAEVHLRLGQEQVRTTRSYRLPLRELHSNTATRFIF